MCILHMAVFAKWEVEVAYEFVHVHLLYDLFLEELLYDLFFSERYRNIV